MCLPTCVVMRGIDLAYDVVDDDDEYVESRITCMET